MCSCVDTYFWRVCISLGLIGKKVSADNAHDLLQTLLPNDARVIYNFHKALLRHGQRICGMSVRAAINARLLICATTKTLWYAQSKAYATFLSKSTR